MNTQLPIIRCPHCHRNHLSAFLDNEQTSNGWAGLLMMHPLVRLISKLIRTDNTYWLCQDCGCTFPLKDY